MGYIEKYKSEAKKANVEQYIASSIIRFGRLHDYIQEKILVDYFAIKGNLMIAEGLRQYLKKNLDKLQKLPKINLLDVGPAIGAITTLICLQVLNEFELLEKTRVHLIDVSEKVITLTQSGNFFYPTSILNPHLKGKIIKKLRESKSVIASAENIPWKNSNFQIVLAGFVFHHLHKNTKPLVAKEICRTLTPGGFLGVAEEWFKNYENDYAVLHKDDQIPLAYESIISYKDLTKLLPNIRVFFAYDKHTKENFYAFCGTKEAKK